MYPVSSLSVPFDDFEPAKADRPWDTTGPILTALSIIRPLA